MTILVVTTHSKKFPGDASSPKAPERFHPNCADPTKLQKLWRPMDVPTFGTKPIRSATNNTALPACPSNAANADYPATICNVSPASTTADDRTVTSSGTSFQSGTETGK